MRLIHLSNCTSHSLMRSLIWTVWKSAKKIPSLQMNCSRDRVTKNSLRRSTSSLQRRLCHQSSRQIFMFLITNSIRQLQNSHRVLKMRISMLLKRISSSSVTCLSIPERACREKCRISSLTVLRRSGAWALMQLLLSIQALQKKSWKSRSHSMERMRKNSWRRPGSPLTTMCIHASSNSVRASLIWSQLNSTRTSR